MGAWGNLVLSLGTTTQYGQICGVTHDGTERYYFIVDNETGVVSFMPASVVE